MVTALAKPQNLTIRIPPEVLEEVRSRAELETRSINGEIVQLLKEALLARKLGVTLETTHV
jgi:hypothetical protein